MSQALDEVCEFLDLRSASSPARLVMAERIIELARKGERSPTRLRELVLEESGFGSNGSRPLRWSGC
jgi:hypothetical protein